MAVSQTSWSNLLLLWTMWHSTFPQSKAVVEPTPSTLSPTSWSSLSTANRIARWMSGLLIIWKFACYWNSIRLSLPFSLKTDCKTLQRADELSGNGGESFHNYQGWRITWVDLDWNADQLWKNLSENLGRRKSIGRISRNQTEARLLVFLEQILHGQSFDNFCFWNHNRKPSLQPSFAYIQRINIENRRKLIELFWIILLTKFSEFSLYLCVSCNKICHLGN